MDDSDFNHHETEAQIREDGQEYAAAKNEGAPAEELRARLDDMTEDTDCCIQARQEEQEYLGDENGQDAYDAHEERIRVLEANKGAFALEKQHVDEVAAGRESSEWNEETGEWGPIKEADYSAEEGPSS